MYLMADVSPSSRVAYTGQCIAIAIHLRFNTPLLTIEWCLESMCGNFLDQADHQVLTAPIV